MALTTDSEVREVYGISEEQKLKIIDFLQGAVYCWCKNRPDEWFSMRDLMGGENYYWQGTPLYDLYNKHEKKYKDDWRASVEAAGKDSGWLLKKVIKQDKRKFETKKEELIRKYRWIKEDENY